MRLRLVRMVIYRFGGLLCKYPRPRGRELSESGSVYFCAIPSSSPVQNQLSFAEVDFSLFVLELPLQNEKRKSSSTIRFGSQIEKQKLEFTIRFGTSASNSKSRIVFPLFVLELSLPKRKAELLELNFRFGT